MDFLRTQNLTLMKKATTYEAAFRSVLLFFCYVLSIVFCYTLSAQNSKATFSGLKATEKQKKDYQDLKNLGYTDKEIYEDLGNVYFMSKKYESAVFWYANLKQAQKTGELSASYQARYQYALAKAGIVQVDTDQDDTKDWMAMIKADYQVDKKSKSSSYHRPSSNSGNSLSLHDKVDQFFDSQLVADNDMESFKKESKEQLNAFGAPMVVTADGNTAYFTKAVFVKPEYGLFSKKQVVHKIYKADKINGKWKNIKQVKLGPKYSSAIHPTVSEDGKRLFFASDMPGTFGKFDIYVAEIYKNGAVGIAKNLGEKVNTKKNDLYPNIVDGKTLFFASNGRKGYGGMDIYMAQVGQKKVQWSVNLGSPINSAEDDYSIFLSAETGKGYVMSNRGEEKGSIQRVAFSYVPKRKNTSKATMDYNLLEALNSSSKVDYSNAFFEDE